ncbi:MAG: AI-2E family transporter [Vicinamibacterales bacterium]
MNATLTPTRVMLYTASVLFVIFLAWLLLQIKSVIIILILGIILAAAIEPFVLRLRRLGLSRGQAIMTVYLGLALTLGGIGYLVIPPLIRQGMDLFNDIPNILDNLQEQARVSNNDFINTTGVRAIGRAEQAFEDYKASPPVEESTAIVFVTSVLGGIFTIFSVLIVAFYWMTEKAIIKRLLLGLIPLDRRDEAHAIWDEIEEKLGGWTRGQAVLCFSIGLASGISYYLLGLEFWLALAIWAGITELIPFIGPFLGGAAAVIIALTDSWEKALAVVVIVVIIQQLEGAVLVPRVMKNAVGLSPLAVVLAVIVGGALLGVIGAVLAIPVAAAVQVLVSHLVARRIGDLDALSASMATAGAGSQQPDAPPAHLGRNNQPARQRRIGLKRRGEA